MLKLRHTCFDGTRGSNIVNADGSEVASILGPQPDALCRAAGGHAAGRGRAGLRIAAWLAGATVVLSGRTKADSFRGSIAGLRSAYCDSPAIKGARMLCIATGWRSCVGYADTDESALIVMLSRRNARRFPLIAGTALELHRFKTGAALHADRGNQTPCALSNHSLTVRTTLEVGRALTVLPPNSFMIDSSYSGSVLNGSFAVTCTIL